MIHALVIDMSCVKYHCDPSYSWNACYSRQTNFCYVCDFDLGSRTWHSYVKYQPYESKKLGSGHKFWLLVHFLYVEPWPWRRDLEITVIVYFLHTLTVIMKNYMIPIYLNDKDTFWLCMHCDLDFGDMTFGQGHGAPFCYEQQLCDILSIISIYWMHVDVLTLCIL